ncbi:MAG: hypothetical protein IIV78_02980, partial [Oscillospiraceae bacterium]|nr:hypothetical protein [Oscillospiraceae bacterium]
MSQKTYKTGIAAFCGVLLAIKAVVSADAAAFSCIKGRVFFLHPSFSFSKAGEPLFAPLGDDINDEKRRKNDEKTDSNSF